jgi:hypothetical protein
MAFDCSDEQRELFQISDDTPDGCAPTVELHFFGASIRCRRCENDVLIAAGLYPARPPQSYCGLHLYQSDQVRRLVGGLYSSTDTVFVTTVELGLRVPRGRCECGKAASCSEDWFLDTLAGDGFDALSLLAAGPVPTPDWQRVLHFGDAVVVGNGI